MKVNSVRGFLDVYETGEGPSHPFYVDAPLEVWLEIINTHPELRKAVASNKTIPDEVIRELAQNESSRVRNTIARKRKTPEDVLLALSGDPDGMVRHTVACNPKVTGRVLALLVDDEWELVRESARERLKEMEEPDDGEE